MSKPNEPASPYTGVGTEGLTKREYFAVMAMQGLLAGGDTDMTTKRAVMIADRLIERLDGAEK